MIKETHKSISRIGRRLVNTALTAAVLLVPVVAGAQPVPSRASPNYTFTVLHAFKGPADGAYPYARLARAKDGDLYGTSWAGGGDPNCPGGLGVGCGTLFRVDPSGKVTVIYSFVGLPGPMHLYGGLLPANDGSLYGLTNEGGTSQACFHSCGTIFKLDANDRLTVLYDFGTNGGTSDANYPDGDLVRDPSGNLYGTSSRGGAGDNGTIFEVSKSGTEAVLYRFTGGTDGSAPSGSLLRDTAGNLYGTASGGGGPCGCGTVFKLDASGGFSVIHTFQGGRDGGTPTVLGGLIADSSGNLYGATYYGGSHNAGVVFAIAPDGRETVLHAFEDSPDGRFPASRLAMDKPGNLYGTTLWGGNSHKDCTIGSSGCGVVFEVTRDGKERVLHAFDGKGGMYPWGGVYADGSGNLFGTTWFGGKFDRCTNGCGIVYELSPSAPVR